MVVCPTHFVKIRCCHQKEDTNKDLILVMICWKNWQGGGLNCRFEGPCGNLGADKQCHPAENRHQWDQQPTDQNNQEPQSNLIRDDVFFRLRLEYTQQKAVF